jgi:predicted amidophosphoribosyltransferase
MKPDPDLVVHHRNGNGLDNRRANLQITTTRVNLRHAHISKKCPACSDPIDEWWNYCAMCGYHLAGGELEFSKTSVSIPSVADLEALR